MAESSRLCVRLGYILVLWVDGVCSVRIDGSLLVPLHFKNFNYVDYSLALGTWSHLKLTILDPDIRPYWTLPHRICVFPEGLMRVHGKEETSLPAHVYCPAKSFSGALFLLKYHLLFTVV